MTTRRPGVEAAAAFKAMKQERPVGESYHFAKPGPEIEARAGQILAQMTLEEKVGCGLEGSFRVVA
jgi:hypothetical protein